MTHACSLADTVKKLHVWACCYCTAPPGQTGKPAAAGACRAGVVLALRASTDSFPGGSSCRVLRYAYRLAAQLLRAPHCTGSPGVRCSFASWVGSAPAAAAEHAVSPRCACLHARALTCTHMACSPSPPCALCRIWQEGTASPPLAALAAAELCGPLKLAASSYHSCRGVSSSAARGYTCGLWVMWHATAVRRALCAPRLPACRPVTQYSCQWHCL